MTERFRTISGRTFGALRSRNYRLYFFGQIASMSGTWMQTVAQAWLVLRLTGSGVALGVVTALQFLPLLLFGPWGGVVADRLDRRRLLLVTQSIAASLALALGVLTATGAIRLWMVFTLAFCLGGVTVFDNPARQSYVHDMVGPDLLTNAVTLNSVVMNASRVVGPALAGVLIATMGIAPCFLINAASYLFLIGGLLLMRPSELHPAVRAERQRGQLRDGFRYVWSTPALRTPLIMMAVIGTLAYEFQVTLPLLARYTFHGGAGTYGAMTAFIGGGAVLGGLVSASRGPATPRRLTLAALVFGVLILVVAAMPTLPALLIVLPFMGAASITFIAMANATLQLTAAPEMRGRVMALWAVAFLGSTPVGGPLVGWIAEAFGARSALVVGGLATIGAALYGWRTLAGVRVRAGAENVAEAAAILVPIGGGR